MVLIALFGLLFVAVCFFAWGAFRARRGQQRWRADQAEWERKQRMAADVVAALKEKAASHGGKP